MITDQHLAGYIDSIFSHYDRDNSNSLDSGELVSFFNDLYRAMGANKTITMQEAQQALGVIDNNHDGRVNRSELFEAFKKVLSKEGFYVGGQQIYMNTGNDYSEAMQMWKIAR